MHKPAHLPLKAFTVMMLGALALQAQAADTFIDLGLLPGGTSSLAYGVSADGSTVVGYASNSANQTEAFRWTSGTGMTGLGFLGTGTRSYAFGVSADGSTVVGGGQ